MYSKLRKVAARTLLPLFTVILFISPLQGLGGNSVEAASNIADDGVYRIVAIGDSLTAGYEYGFTEQSVPYGYVEHVYEQALFHGLRAEYVNYGILGLKTEGFSKLIAAAANRLSVTPDDIQAGLPDPRVDKVVSQTASMADSIEAADLIVITIGGNDLVGIVDKLDSGLSYEEVSAQFETMLDAYEKQLESTLRLLLKQNANAQIVVSDQYLPIPAPMKIGSMTIPLYPEEDRQFLITCVNQLGERLKAVEARLHKDNFNMKPAFISAVFSNNELSLTSIADGDIHPNRQGYAAMGNAFSKVIWGDYRTVRSRSADTPISVVVDGKELPTSSSLPVLRSNRTFVPMRDITDAIGAKLQWNNSAQSASVEYNGHLVIFTIGSSSVKVDGATVKLNSPPAFLRTIGKETKTYLPLAALSDALGLQVVYRSTIQTAFINK